MRFRFSGLPLERFRALFDLSDSELAGRGIQRLAAGAGYPCRITLEDAEPGEPVLLLPFEHQPAATPYRSSGPIFVRQHASQTRVTEAVPPSFRPRLFSARAYDGEGLMIDADIAEGNELEGLIDRLLEPEQSAYLHLHHARRGCYACRVDRA